MKHRPWTATPALLFLFAVFGAGSDSKADEENSSTETLTKTQVIYNVAACPSSSATQALEQARRYTAGYTDPNNHKLFILNLAAHGVPRHAQHAATSHIEIVRQRQGIEPDDELIFSQFCGAASDFSNFVSYVASKGEIGNIADSGDWQDSNYTPAADRTITLTRFDAVKCEDPAVYKTLDTAAKTELYNPQPVRDPSGVHYLRSVMDSALLGITTYADEAARSRDDGEEFTAFCNIVKDASESLMRAQKDYNDQMINVNAEQARESQDLGLEALKQKALQEEAEKAKQQDPGPD
jgi:hypothetical protein